MMSYDVEVIGLSDRSDVCREFLVCCLISLLSWSCWNPTKKLCLFLGIKLSDHNFVSVETSAWLHWSFSCQHSFPDKQSSLILMFLAQDKYKKTHFVKCCFFPKKQITPEKSIIIWANLNIIPDGVKYRVSALNLRIFFVTPFLKCRLCNIGPPWLGHA